MSMTELERAKQGQACASAVWDEHYERFGVGIPKWINKSLAYWQCRVTELEAAEKEAEPVDGSPMGVATLTVRLEALSGKLTRMRLDYYGHQHLSSDGTTSTPFTPSKD